jgi:probable F420-dependent oxidoreductase
MFGPFGVWGPWQQGWADEPERVAELEELGYSTFWLGSSPNADLAMAERLLNATKNITIATGVVNVWDSPAAEVSRSFHRLGSDRFVLGVGPGHRQIDQAYEKPYAKLVSYLDELDVPQDRVVLAALSPKTLKLAAERTAGSHPYLVPVAHTAYAREVLGPDKVLAPEVFAVVDEDPDAARALARQWLGYYLPLTNYTNNLLKFGFTAEDFADGGSDRLVDGLVAWGAPEQVAARLREHLDAGANHVAIQSLNGRYAELAKALF